MSRWRIIWDALTGRDHPVIEDHERRLTNLETKVSIIEGMDAFRRMVGEDER